MIAFVPIQNATRGKDQNGLGVGDEGDPMYTLDQASQHGVAHTLRADGFDASEDGTGRGTPLVPFRKSRRAQSVEDHETWVPDEVANTLNTLNTFDSGDVRTTQMIAFQQNQRDEVRDLGDVAGALPAQPGMKQQNYLAYGISNQPTPKYAEGLMPTLNAHNLGGGSQESVAFAMRGRDGGNVPEVSGDVSPAIRGASGGSTHTHVAYGITGQHTAAEELLPTMQTPSSSGGGHPPAVATQMAVRRLTPRECERLQGFPDDWTVPAGSDSARYRALGNAVAVPVVERIGRQIVSVLR